MSGDVAMYNVTAYIHEMLTETRYEAFGKSGEDTAGAEKATKEEIDEDGCSELLRSSEVAGAESECKEEMKPSMLEGMGVFDGLVVIRNKERRDKQYRQTEYTDKQTHGYTDMHRQINRMDGQMKRYS